MERQIQPVTSTPVWQRAAIWIAITLGIVVPIAWIPAYFGYRRWMTGGPTPKWAVFYGSLTALIFVVAIGGNALGVL